MEIQTVLLATRFSSNKPATKICNTKGEVVHKTACSSTFSTKLTLNTNGLV